MKRIIAFVFMLVIVNLPIFAQTVSTQVGSGQIWADSLLSSRTTRTVSFDLYYSGISIASINKSTTITDSVKIESGTIRYKMNIGNKGFPTVIDTAWSSFGLLTDDGVIIPSRLVINTGFNKDCLVQEPNVQLLKFTLLNKNTSAKYYFRVRAINYK